MQRCGQFGAISDERVAQMSHMCRPDFAATAEDRGAFVAPMAGEGRVRDWVKVLARPQILHRAAGPCDF